MNGFGAAGTQIFLSILRHAQDERKYPYQPKQGSYL